jgi:hypothetical protein
VGSIQRHCKPETKGSKRLKQIHRTNDNQGCNFNAPSPVRDSEVTFRRGVGLPSLFVMVSSEPQDWYIDIPHISEWIVFWLTTNHLDNTNSSYRYSWFLLDRPVFRNFPHLSFCSCAPFHSILIIILLTILNWSILLLLFLFLLLQTHPVIMSWNDFDDFLYVLLLIFLFKGDFLEGKEAVEFEDSNL